MRPRTGSSSGAGGPHRDPRPRTLSAFSMAQAAQRPAGRRASRDPEATAGHHGTRSPRAPPPTPWRPLGGRSRAHFCVRPRPTGSGCSLPAGSAPPRPTPPVSLPPAGRAHVPPTSTRDRVLVRVGEEGTEERTRGSSVRDFTSLLEGDRARRSTSGLRGGGGGHSSGRPCHLAARLRPCPPPPLLTWFCGGGCCRQADAPCQLEDPAGGSVAPWVCSTLNTPGL